MTDAAALPEALAAAALAAARRFASGATMWCVAPGWPAHGRHVAVEFVHPVIVGKRALPAVYVDDADLVVALRMVARPGDLLMVIGGAGDEGVAGLLRRAEPWGLTSLWFGAGPRPAAGAADHVVWLDDADPATAPYTGDVVLQYHLLWELTHVVFEHPGLLQAEARGTGDVCITCSDEGRVAEVTVVHDDDRADVLAGGSLETIDVSLVEPLACGDLVLVHAGVAITRLEESQS